MAADSEVALAGHYTKEHFRSIFRLRDWASNLSLIKILIEAHAKRPRTKRSKHKTAQDLNDPGTKNDRKQNVPSSIWRNLKMAHGTKRPGT
jgi:hypothetical protein